MRFDVEDVFLAAGPAEMASMFTAGVVMGFMFAGRMSAHLTVFAYAFRLVVIGGVFLSGMFVTRGVGGSERYEAWVGITIVYLVYVAGVTIGLIFYDRQFKRQIEAELGRPLRSNPRGFIVPSKRKK